MYINLVIIHLLLRTEMGEVYKGRVPLWTREEENLTGRVHDRNMTSDGKNRNWSWHSSAPACPIFVPVNTASHTDNPGLYILQYWDLFTDKLQGRGLSDQQIRFVIRLSGNRLFLLYWFQSSGSHFGAPG